MVGAARLRAVGAKTQGLYQRRPSPSRTTIPRPALRWIWWPRVRQASSCNSSACSCAALGVVWCAWRSQWRSTLAWRARPNCCSAAMRGGQPTWARSCAANSCSSSLAWAACAALRAKVSRQRGVVVGLEAQDDDRGRVRRAGEAEAVGVFDAQAVDSDPLGRASEAAFGLELVDQREGFALGHLEVEFRGRRRIRQAFQRRAVVVVIVVVCVGVVEDGAHGCCLSAINVLNYLRAATRSAG